jgi:hypothetical protein
LKRREKGLPKAGNARVRRGLIQLAWRFLMFQKDSALARWRAGEACVCRPTRGLRDVTEGPASDSFSVQATVTPRCRRCLGCHGLLDG